jgi:enoyl-CoA hydratase/carnithine racemase
MAELVLVELHGNRGELVLNRPERRNALIGPLVNQLHEGLNQLMSNPECHVIVIRGAQGYFCAGLDLKEFAAVPAPEWRERFANDWAEFHCAIFDCPKPILGALEGFAIAGGSALAFACDFLVAGKKSFLHVAEAERGMQAPINIAWLQLRFEYSKAMRFAQLAERFYGDELVGQGVALESVEEDQVLSRTREIADRLAGFEPGSTSRIKASIRKARGIDDFRQLILSVRDTQ